jgi:HD-like signal output (HDOD) protein
MGYVIMNHQATSSLYNSDDILKQLQKVSNLPPFPKVLQEITQLFNSPDVSAKKIEKLVEKDPSLTLKILSVANSPLFGLKRNVNTIGTAVLILGIQELKSVVTSIKMASALKMQADKYFDPNKFLNHSMIIGILTQRMAKDLGFNFDGDGFIAGMLHDMGIVIIHEHLPKEFLEIVDYASQNNTTLLEAEYKILGLSHQEIGEFLTNKWSLPAVFSDALQFHHKPGSSRENNYLTSILHIADYATSRFDEKGILWDENYKIDSSTIDLLNFLSIEGLNEFIDAYKADYLEVSKVKII